MKIKLHEIGYILIVIGFGLLGLVILLKDSYNLELLSPIFGFGISFVLFGGVLTRAYTGFKEKEIRND